MSLRTHAEAWFSRLWWRSPPTLVARALQPASWLASAVAAAGARRSSRDAGRAPVPVLVVGNLVVGGAGKTPTVMALAEAFRAQGLRPGVISRGWGRHGDLACAVQPQADPAEVGDEPLLIQRRTGVPVWVGRDRAAVAQALCAAHPEVELLLSDDGLQHLALVRQAELLVFDERGAGNGLLLPAGPLRQPLPQRLGPIQRVLYTAGQTSTALPGALARRQITAAWPLAAWRAGDAAARQPLANLAGRPLLAAAGMAAPEKFFRMLQAQGLEIERLPLPDHHPFTQLPWPPQTCDVLVTEKDAVKLQAAHMGSTRVWVVPLDFNLPAEFVADLLGLLFPGRTLSPAAPEAGH